MHDTHVVALVHYAKLQLVDHVFFRVLNVIINTSFIIVVKSRHLLFSFFFFLNDPAPPEFYSLPLPAAFPIPGWRGPSTARVAAPGRSRSPSRSRDSGRRYAGPCSPPAYASQNRGGGPRPSRRCARGERPAVCTGARCSGSCWRSRGSGRKPVRFLQSCSRDSSAAATWPRMLPSCTPDLATSTGPSPGLTGRRTRVRRSPQPPCSRKSWGPRFGTCAAIRGSTECASVWDCRADSAL